MPTIQNYSAPVVSGIPSPRRAQGKEIANGEGLQNLSDALDENAKNLVKIDRQNQALSAEKLYSQTYLQAQSEIIKLRESATGDEDLTPQTLAIYDKYAQEASKQDGLSSYQKKYLDAKFTDSRGNVGLSALSYESDLKAQKRVLDLQEKIDASQNIILNDPSQFHSQIADAESAIDLAPLNGVAKEKLKIATKQGLAQSYIQSLGNLNPDAARRQLESPEVSTLIDPGAKVTLRSAIDAEQERRVRLAKQAEIDQAKKTQNEMLTKFYTDGLNMNDVLASKLPAFGQGSKQEFIDLIKKGPTEGNPALHQEVYIKALNGELNDPSQLVPYITQPNGLSVQEAQNVASLLDDERDQAVKTFVNGAKATITGSNDLLGIPDPEGDQNFSAFLFDVQKQLQAGKKKGLTAQDLFDPSSKDYIGSKLISSYRKTPQEKMEALTRNLQNQNAIVDPQARKSGESLQDWLERKKSLVK